jgi:hypothetical protein
MPAIKHMRCKRCGEINQKSDDLIRNSYMHELIRFLYVYVYTETKYITNLFKYCFTLFNKMDTNNEAEFEFIRTKTVTELKDICRENNVCGFSRLRKNELFDLLINYYKKNPEQLKKDLQAEEEYIQNNETLFDNLIVEPQQSIPQVVPQVVPYYIQGPVQEVVKRVIVQHVRAPFVSTEPYKIQPLQKTPKATKEPKATKATKEPKVTKEPKAPKPPKASKAPKAAKAPKPPKAAKAPKAPKAPKPPKPPKAAKAPKAPKAPKAAKAPKAPKAPKAYKAPKFNNKKK